MIIMSQFILLCVKNEFCGGIASSFLSLPTSLLRSVSPVFEKPAGTSKSPAGTKTGDKYASGGPGRPGPP